MTSKSSRAAGLPEISLWLAAVVLFACGGVWVGRSLLAQKDGQQLLQSLPSLSQPDALGVAAHTPGTVEAELTIPAIGLSAPVLTGCTDGTLRRGACRILGSAVAGGLGNMALAGHRDTNFRPLQRLHVGDIATVADATGRYDYIVSRTEVVLPSAVEVLAVGDRPELTLITCFPFRYVGAAPKRYIVHAYLRSVDGTTR